MFKFVLNTLYYSTFTFHTELRYLIGSILIFVFFFAVYLSILVFIILNEFID